MPPFRIPFYQIALLESGAGEVGSGGKKYDLGNYTLFCTQPNQILYWNVSQNWKGYYISVDESFYTVRLDGFRQLFDLPYFRSYQPGVHLRNEEADLMLGIMSQMHHEYNNPTPYNIPVIKSLLSTVFSYAVRFYERTIEEQTKSASSESLGARFKQLVHHQLTALTLNVSGGQQSISDYADQLSVTLGHLSETVKAELGVTPTDYINEQLIKESQKLLRSTKLQIKEIAYLLDFHDTSYFGRLFKKVTGSTPAKYRSKA